MAEIDHRARRPADARVATWKPNASAGIRIQEVDQSRASLVERSGTLARAYNAKEAALARAEDTVAALNERVAGLENALSAAKETAE